MFDFLNALAPKGSKKSTRPAKSRGSIRPTLETLEDRLTPSSVRPSLLADAPMLNTAPALIAAPTPGTHGSHSRTDAAPTAAAQAAKPSAVIDFSNLVATDKEYTLYVKFIDTAGNEFAQAFTIAPGTGPGAVRDLVLGSIPQSTGLKSQGWSLITNNPTSITVQSYNDGEGNINPIAKIGATTKGRADDKQPSVSVSSGVQRGQTTNGTDWKFSLLPSGIDGNTTVTANAVIEATIDGVAISANITAGETYLQVASDLYNAMAAAGMTDATLSGGDITFLNDTTGQETLTASLTIDGSLSGSQPNDWIEWDVTAPQRNILS
jgi:hypothetical protein